LTPGQLAGSGCPAAIGRRWRKNGPDPSPGRLSDAFLKVMFTLAKFRAITPVINAGDSDT